MTIELTPEQLCLMHMPLQKNNKQLREQMITNIINIYIKGSIVSVIECVSPKYEDNVETIEKLGALTEYEIKCVGYRGDYLLDINFNEMLNKICEYISLDLIINFNNKKFHVSRYKY